MSKITDGHTFTPFAHDTTVCDTCGELVEAHSPAQRMSEFTQAAWRALISHGGVYGLYSGELDWADTLKIRAHFHLATTPERIARANKGFMKHCQVKWPERPCEIDFKRTDNPTMGSVSQFEGTFTNNSEHAAVEGHFWCRCGEFNYQTVNLKGKTIGQLIWLVVQEGEGA